MPTILVVEDSGTQAKVINQMLVKAGAITAFAASAFDFESISQMNNVKIDAALVDVHLGDVNGLTLIKPILKRWPRAAIAMMTANRKDNFSVLFEARKMGAHFVIAKPFTGEDMKEFLLDIKALKKTGKSRKHVIVIDDSQMSRKIAGMMLKEAGFRVSVFEDGMQAVNQLCYDHVDAVLTDMNMPGTTGQELICLVRDVWQDVGIVAMSGDGEYAKTCGADAFIAKPMQPAELIGVVSGVLEATREAEADPEDELELDC